MENQLKMEDKKGWLTWDDFLIVLFLVLTVWHSQHELSAFETIKELAWPLALGVDLGIARAAWVTFRRGLPVGARRVAALWLTYLLGASFCLNFAYYLEKGAYFWYGVGLGSLFPVSLAAAGGVKSFLTQSAPAPAKTKIKNPFWLWVWLRGVWNWIIGKGGESTPVPVPAEQPAPIAAPLPVVNPTPALVQSAPVINPVAAVLEEIPALAPVPAINPAPVRPHLHVVQAAPAPAPIPVEVAAPPKQDRAALLDKVLADAGLTRAKALELLDQYGVRTSERAYSGLKMLGKLPKGMTFDEFAPLYLELKRPAKPAEAPAPVVETEPSSADPGQEQGLSSEDRRRKLAEMVSAGQTINQAELARQWGVSSSMIRKDLAKINAVREEALA